MTKEEIDHIVLPGESGAHLRKPDLIETHISWVFLSDQFVYKIKKPIRYSFLDFSTIELRKYYCEREIELNKRLTENIYLDVQPIRKDGNQFYINGTTGDIVDYAVRMKKQDTARQMNVLLKDNQITPAHIISLAQKIATFHKNAGIVYNIDPHDIQEKFDDLENEIIYLDQQPGNDYSKIITHALTTSKAFTDKHLPLIISRMKAGFCRDCHGDLHSRNIFILDTPQPFDCIEFNDELRQIDVLNENAFLCMDLDSFGRKDLSELYIDHYNKIYPCINTPEDKLLFIYYKSYRANIRAKVNSLRARSAKDEVEKLKALTDCDTYLKLMNSYIDGLDEAK
jgi:aminoglycoside phosphotransferase family enzyme